MSLINKMLQDLDKRHAGDAGGKTLTQQLRPVPARQHWRRIMWEVGAGVIIGLGWSVWVLYQVSPRSVVTELALQSQAKRLQSAAGLQTPPAAPAAQQSVAPDAAVPATQAVAPQIPPAAAMPAPAPPPAASAAPALPAINSGQALKIDTLKLSTEIATPFEEKNVGNVGAKSRATPESTRQPASGATTARRAKHASEMAAGIPLAPGISRSNSGGGAPAAKTQGLASIDKQVHLSTPEDRAESEFRKANGLLNQGRVAEAIDAYKSTLQQHPGHAAARQALVGLLLEGRRIDEAQQFLQEGISLNPDRSAYTMLLARIQVDRGDLQGAHDLLSRHAGSGANSADYHAFDAAVLQRLGRHKEAVSGYQAALQLAPRAGLWWMGMGISLQADNRGAEALDAFRRAKSAGGLSPELLAFVDQRMKQLQ